MGEFLARKGERVMNAATGEVICEAIEDIPMHSIVSAKSFGNFAAGENPWSQYSHVDRRCTRQSTNHPFTALQLFVEGEWRG